MERKFDGTGEGRMDVTKRGWDQGGSNGNLGVTYRRGGHGVVPMEGKRQEGGESEECQKGPE